MMIKSLLVDGVFVGLVVFLLSILFGVDLETATLIAGFAGCFAMWLLIPQSSVEERGKIVIKKIGIEVDDLIEIDFKTGSLRFIKPDGTTMLFYNGEDKITLPNLRNRSEADKLVLFTSGALNMGFEIFQEKTDFFVIYKFKKLDN